MKSYGLVEADVIQHDFLNEDDYNLVILNEADFEHVSSNND